MGKRQLNAPPPAGAGAATNLDGYTQPQHSRQAAFSLFYLFIFSCAMFTLPFGSYFLVQHFVREHYPDATQFVVTAYSVLATVCTVNAIIVAYAVLAYHETEYDEEGNEVDQLAPPPPPPPQAATTTPVVVEKSSGGGGGDVVSKKSKKKKAQKEL